MELKRLFVLPALILAYAVLLCGCAVDEMPDYREKEYGYVQFKVYKNIQSKALDYLRDAHKLKVTMQYEDELIAQTMILNSYDNENAEYGLRSDKLKLLAGEYDVVSFELYDRYDKVNYVSTELDIIDNGFVLSPGGLLVHDLFAVTTARGKLRFNLVKDTLSFVNRPDTKAGASDQFTFDQVEKVDLTVRNPRGRDTTYASLPAEFSVHFDEDDVYSDSLGYRTSSVLCDTVLIVPAGRYSVLSYKLYDEDGVLLGLGSMKQPLEFEVEDNVLTETDVPVLLDEAADYIQDYYALYQIWVSLNGKDWFYNGEDWPEGANWNFNKDPDLWGDQPGVSLHANGRVAMVDLSGFGFHGHMSPALGQLTQLVELYLGNHNDNNILQYDPSVAKGLDRHDRMSRHREYLRLKHTPTQVSEPIARALKEHGINIPEMSLYESRSESEIIEHGTGRMKADLMDMNPGKLCNGLKSLPEEIKELTKLETLYIANGELSALPAGMTNLKSCTDLEIYNCPEMTEFPAVIAKMPALVSLNLSCNPQWGSIHGKNEDSEEITESDHGLELLANGESRKLIQILYMNDCGLTQVGPSVRNMEKIGLLDLANNDIRVIKKAFTTKIKPVQLYLDNNELDHFPTEDGFFCGIEDIETFSVRNNNFTVFPDIFDAKSLYTMGSVDFSYNHISRFENVWTEEDVEKGLASAVDTTSYKGMNVSTLTITNNPEFTTYPACLSQSLSIVGNVNFRGCNISSIPKNSFYGRHVVYLSSLDLSYNDLTDLPRELNAANLPYLYGIELSYNHFTEFPWEPSDSQYLTVFAIRGQRDEKTGARCFREWPTGIYNHRGLRGLYLGSNDIRKVEDTISTLCYYLEISDNPNIVFPAGDICYAYQAGAFYLIYDKKQKITGCDFMLDN